MIALCNIQHSSRMHTTHFCDWGAGAVGYTVGGYTICANLLNVNSAVNIKIVKYLSFSKIDQIAIQLITLKLKCKQILPYYRHT